jgi:hypothetical protein
MRSLSLRLLRRRLSLCGASALFLFCAHCGNATAEAGQRYLARGQSALAWEYLQAAIAEDPRDQGVRDAAILAQETQKHSLTQAVTQLSHTAQPLRALSQLVVMEELQAAGKALQLTGDGPEVFAPQKHALIEAASTGLLHDLDARLSRSAPRPADLASCNTLQSLTPDDTDVGRACGRLLRAFKHVAVLEAAPGAHPASRDVIAATTQHITEQHPQLLEALPAANGEENAKLQIFVEAPRATSFDYTLERREVYHTFVQRLDDKGRPVTETVMVPPSAEAVAQAQAQKRPPPGPVATVKKVFDEVVGEYRHYVARREVAVRYGATLLDARDDSFVAAASDVARATSESRFALYTGDPRAQRPPEKGLAMRRADAPSLRSEADLTREAYNSAAALISTAMIRGTE